MNGLKVKVVIFFQIILMGFVFHVSGEFRYVTLRKKGTTPPVFKMECLWQKGKYDAFPTYKCPNKEGDLIEFDPGKAWEEVTISKVCFHNMLRDSIKVGFKVLGEKDTLLQYIRIRKNKEVISFTPNEKKWKILTEEHPSCAPHVIELDPLRSITILKPDESDETNGDASAKKGK